MTNKGCKRNKRAPFCLEIVSKVQSDGKDQSTSEGFFHIQPRKESIKEGSALRNQLLVTADTSNTLKALIKKITNSFPASLPNQTSGASLSQDANKLDRGLHPDSFVFLRYAITIFYSIFSNFSCSRLEGGKKPTLGRALAVTETECLVEIFKMKGKKNTEYFRDATEITWIDRTFILCCNFFVQDETEENCLFLKENPQKMLTNLGIRDT